MWCVPSVRYCYGDSRILLSDAIDEPAAVGNQPVEIKPEDGAAIASYPQVDDHELGFRFRQANHLFLNEEGRFTEIGSSSGPGLAAVRSFRAAAFGDYDNDGDIDIFVTALDEPALLLRNDTTTNAHYLQLRLVGTKSNRDGVGARVTVVTAGHKQIGERTGGGSYLSASDPRLHFGLGSAASVDRIEVRWPSGQRDVLRQVEADRLITVKEGNPGP